MVVVATFQPLQPSKIPATMNQNLNNSNNNNEHLLYTHNNNNNRNNNLDQFSNNPNDVLLPLPLQLPPLHINNNTTSNRYPIYQNSTMAFSLPAIFPNTIPNSYNNYSSSNSSSNGSNGSNSNNNNSNFFARSNSDVLNFTTSSLKYNSQNSLPSLNFVLSKIQSTQTTPLPLPLNTNNSLLSNNSFNLTPITSSENLNTQSSVSSVSPPSPSLSSSPSSSTPLSLLASKNSSTSNSSSFTPPSPTNRKYKCKICDKGFTTSGHLARHHRIHTGVKNHICPFEGCNSRFSRQDNCMQHYKTHLKSKKGKKKFRV
jgi:uncharacterized Zn-finger protein